MSMPSALLNLIWLILGGLGAAMAWGLAALIMAVTILGIPWARAAVNIAIYTLLPFGQKAVARDLYSGRGDIGTGVLGEIGNVIWLLLAGWWLALLHGLAAIILGVTIVGLPFAWAHLKLGKLAVWPIGKMIVLADDLPPSFPQRQ